MIMDMNLVVGDALLFVSIGSSSVLRTFDKEFKNACCHLFLLGISLLGLC